MDRFFSTVSSPSANFYRLPRPQSVGRPQSFLPPKTYLTRSSSVAFHYLFRDREPSLLRPATLQKHETCWAVAFTRLLEAMLRLLSPEFQDDWELSTQDMINQVRLISERTTSGHLDKLETAMDPLKRGLVRESVCPLTYALDTTELDYENDNPPRYGLRNMEIMNWYEHFDADFDALETFVVKRLEKSPVVISIPAYDTYLNIPSNFGTGLYIPYIEEQKDFVAPAGKHLVLCTGYGVTASGVSYLEIQDTKGPRFADGGFLRIAMGCKMVREVVVMDV